MAAKLTGPGPGRFAIQQNAEINVTPFVDVMLVLLIIFMVAAPMATVAIPVDLPPADANAPKPPSSPTYVSIQKSGDLFVSDRQTTLATIGQDLPAAMAVNGVARDFQAERVYVRADADVPYERFITVMNTLQDNGYYKVGLVAEEIK
jgi:biopolymer transport protein ExbD